MDTETAPRARDDLQKWLKANRAGPKWLSQQLAAAGVPTHLASVAGWLAGRYIPSPPRAAALEALTGIEARRWERHK